MAEHLLIGDIAALLLVLGFTGPMLAPLLRNRVIGRLRVLTHPVVAVVVWAVNFYVWHLPALYQAALRHDVVHALEHATFLGFGIAMWMGLLGPLPKPEWFGNGGPARLHRRGPPGRDRAGQRDDLRRHRLLPLLPRRRRPLAHQPAGRSDRAGGVMMVEESILTIGLFCWLFLKVAREGEERQALLDYAAAQGSRSTSGGRPGRWPPGAARSCGSCGHGRRPGPPRRRYLTVSVPFMPAASWPSTEQ